MNYKILTSYHLKLIALITMCIDHFGFIFFPSEISFRLIGRASFVIYAFLLVEGFKHSNNTNKYLLKLLVWGIISEIPFDLVVFNKPFSLEKQNIFFTLFIGLFGLKFYKQYTSKIYKILIVLGSLIFAEFLKVDYSWYGIGIIYLFYVFYNYEILKYSTIQTLNFIASFKIFVLQMYGLIGLIPIFMYNQKLGKRTGIIFYSFYSINLLVFYIIKSILYNK